MLKQKVTALALGALGLTGFLFGLTCAVVASQHPELEQADIQLLTEFTLIGIFGGSFFLIWGGKKWDKTTREVKQETKQLATV